MRAAEESQKIDIDALLSPITSPLGDREWEPFAIPPPRLATALDVAEHEHKLLDKEFQDWLNMQWELSVYDEMGLDKETEELIHNFKVE